MRVSVKRCVKYEHYYYLLCTLNYFNNNKKSTHTHTNFSYWHLIETKKNTDQSLTLIRTRLTFIQNPFRFPCSQSCSLPLLSCRLSSSVLFFFNNKYDQHHFILLWLKYIWFNWFSREIGFLCWAFSIFRFLKCEHIGISYIL